MLHINYLFVSAARPLKLSAIRLPAESLVPELLEVVHKRNKPLQMGSDWLEAYHINIPLTDELETLLQTKWTYEMLLTYCTGDRRMKNYMNVGKYVAQGSEEVLHVMVLVP